MLEQATVCGEGMTSEVRRIGVYRNRKVGTVARQLIPHHPSYLGDGGPKRIWMILRLGRNSSPSLFPGLGERMSSLSDDLPLVI